MAYQGYDEYEFRLKLQGCLDKIKLILSSEKSQVQAADNVEHRYEDKYLLSSSLSNITIASLLNSFSHLGLTPQVLSKLKEWVTQKEVSLRFESIEKCAFVKQITRDVEDPVKYETQKQGPAFFSTITNRSYITITEYIYVFNVEYRISAFCGVGEHDLDGFELFRRSNAKHSVILRSKESPYPASRKVSHDVNISFLLRNLTEKMTPCFEIDRSSKECHTPRQNKNVNDFVEEAHRLQKWCNNIRLYLEKELIAVELNHRDPSTGNQPLPDLSAINTTGIFFPMAPLFVDNSQLSEHTSAGLLTNDSSSATDVTSSTGSSSTTSSVMLNNVTQSQIMAEQSRSLDDKLFEVCKHFPDITDTHIISKAEVTIAITAMYIFDLVSFYTESLEFIEDMLRKQLIAAVGKELTANDFSEYMKFHNRKLFKAEFQPRPFSHSIRRSITHSPEGSIRIEEKGTLTEPVNTVSCTASAESVKNFPPMQFVLNASTKVTFNGDRTIHACLMHKFSGQQPADIQLVTEARQFSSYIVLIGRICSATLFEPKFGIIVQNKDDIKIPLDLEQIPTPKEFKDAIKSLSPEQQRFAQAYRSMQLESTLFGICVIQIKPQLEKLLKLTPDSLTKEICLTQDLMELFIKYQIPSDLLTFEGSDTSDSYARLTAVKGHVKAIQDMIESTKKKEVEEKKVQREYDNELSAFGGVPLNQNLSRSMPSTNETSFGSPSGGGFDGVTGMRFSKRSIPAARNLVMLDAPVSNFSTFSSPMPPPAPAMAMMTQIQQQQPPPPQVPNVIQQQTQLTSQQNELSPSGSMSTSSSTLDYTAYPGKLDKAYELYDVDSALRPTIINPRKQWMKTTQKNLLESPSTIHLNEDLLSKEKNAAFDLLDALSRSGALTIDKADLHIVIAATHCFDRSLMDTIIQKNVNPIERVERSVLIMASTIHGVQSSQLIEENQLARVNTFSPMLFLTNNA